MNFYKLTHRSFGTSPDNDSLPNVADIYKEAIFIRVGLFKIAWPQYFECKLGEYLVLIHCKIKHEWIVQCHNHNK